MSIEALHHYFISISKTLAKTKTTQSYILARKKRVICDLFQIRFPVPTLVTSVFSAGPLESQEREVELGKRRKLFTIYDVHEEIGRCT